MDKLPFVDKYGRMTYCEDKQAFVRERQYIIIKKGNSIICNHDAKSDLFSLPTNDEIEINAKPTLNFKVLSFLYENRHPIRETQFYQLYDVEDADMAHTPLQWCSLKDIALKNIMFNATQLIGIKHLFVRIYDYDKDL